MSTLPPTPPLAFARNRLVLAVPAARSSGARVRSLADVAEPGVRLVVGSPSVPVGSYTRLVIERLPAARRRRVLGNVRSNEPDVASIAAKLAQGAGDAGFVYATDVRASGGRLRAIGLPPHLQPDVLYAVAVVKGSERREQARSFVRGLLDGNGAAALRRAGFRSPRPR
jgi:molybdate transport system substrate-binding protein